MKIIYLKVMVIGLLGVVLLSASSQRRPVKVWLIGDSTVADYSLETDYMAKRYPQNGWGQVFQQFFIRDSLKTFKGLIKTDSVLVDDRAKGGRSTRSFFEEGRWREVFNLLQPGDLVMIQFGHNDLSEAKVDRHVKIPGYKEFLRLYIFQTREKKAIPVLISPVARNYPWKDGHLENTHGDYPGAMKEVAEELGVDFIDLNQLSMVYFSSKGEEYVTRNYFMNLEPGKFTAFPEGQKDNTHFQLEGATVVARLVFNQMKIIAGTKSK